MFHSCCIMLWREWLFHIHILIDHAELAKRFVLEKLKVQFFNCQFSFYFLYACCNKKKCFKIFFLYRTTTTLSMTPEGSTCPQYNTPIHMMNQSSQYHGQPKSLCRRSICPRHSQPERGPCSCSLRTWPTANDTPTTTIFAKVTWILTIGSRSCQKVQMK